MIFKYKAYNTLLAELGRNDYVVEISELAIREFLDSLKQFENPELFIKEKCQKHSIMLSLDNSNNYYNQITLGHIANVYHLAESFFYEIQTEYNTIVKSNWKFEAGKTKLAQIINFFKSLNRFNNQDKIEQHLIDTFDYYHQLRVYFSHKKTTSEKEIENKWEKAKVHFNEELLKRYKIKAGPKQIQDLDFEDFFLFTQITKEIALRISSLGYPEPKGFSDIPELKKLKKYAVTGELPLRIENYLKTKFGFGKENESDTLAEEIASHL
ncbi:MAG TPA: hypothetical protein PLP23_08150 [Panacibacter sp.]|nr:hypothetical protein [Panacibacter sp.]